MATKKKTTTSKQLVVNKDGSVSVGTVSFNSKGQVTKTSGGGSSSTKITQDSNLTRDQIAERAVQTTNNLYGGDPNAQAYGEQFKPGSGGFAAPATNDAYAGLDVDPNYIQNIPPPIVPPEEPPVVPEVPQLEQQLQEGMASFDQTLNQIYANRPDLQELYNPDGSAKNVNDPRIAGLPTLRDWGQQYGSQEYPELGQALAAIAETPPAPLEGEVVPELGDPLVGPQDEVGQVASVYDQVYDRIGISSLKEQIEKFNKQLLDLRNEKTDKASDINNNPWYTEGKRVGELRRLDEKYEQREANLLGYLQLAEGLLNTGLNQANAMISDVMQLQSQNRKYEQDVVDGRYKLANGMPFYKYPGSALVYSTETGQGLSYDQYIALGGDPGFNNIYEIQPPGREAEATLVMDLAKKYPDAGILPSDSLAVAQEKQKNSAIYRKAILVKGNASTSRGPGSTPSPTTPSSGDPNFVGPVKPGSTPKSSGFTVTAVPKTASANNIRNWLASNWHRLASQQSYYDVWGKAADALRAAGIDPNQYDKTFWDVFRPGEYSTYNQKGTSTSSPTKSSSSFDNL